MRTRWPDARGTLIWPLIVGPGKAFRSMWDSDRDDSELAEWAGWLHKQWVRPSALKTPEQVEAATSAARDRLIVLGSWGPSLATAGLAAAASTATVFVGSIISGEINAWMGYAAVASTFIALLGESLKGFRETIREGVIKAYEQRLSELKQSESSVGAPE